MIGASGHFRSGTIAVDYRAGVLGCLVYAETGASSLGHELDLRFSRAVTGGESER